MMMWWVCSVTLSSSSFSRLESSSTPSSSPRSSPINYNIKRTHCGFFLTLCRDHFTPTLGQTPYLVSSLLIHVHDGPTFDWLVLTVLVTTVTASCFNKNKNVARKHFPFFLTFLHYPIEFQQHFGTFQCLTTYIVWRVEPPVYWSLGEGPPCPGSNHHLCLPYSASSWNSLVLQVFLC